MCECVTNIVSALLQYFDYTFETVQHFKKWIPLTASPKSLLQIYS